MHIEISFWSCWFFKFEFLSNSSGLRQLFWQYLEGCQSWECGRLAVSFSDDGWWGILNNKLCNIFLSSVRAYAMACLIQNCLPLRPGRLASPRAHRGSWICFVPGVRSTTRGQPSSGQDALQLMQQQLEQLEHESAEQHLARCGWERWPLRNICETSAKLRVGQTGDSIEISAKNALLNHPKTMWVVGRSSLSLPISFQCGCCSRKSQSPSSQANNTMAWWCPNLRTLKVGYTMWFWKKRGFWKLPDCPL